MVKPNGDLEPEEAAILLEMYKDHPGVNRKTGEMTEEFAAEMRKRFGITYTYRPTLTERHPTTSCIVFFTLIIILFLAFCFLPFAFSR